MNLANPPTWIFAKEMQGLNHSTGISFDGVQHDNMKELTRTMSNQVPNLCAFIWKLTHNYIKKRPKQLRAHEELGKTDT